jgi:hypothetical protein
MPTRYPEKPNSEKKWSISMYSGLLFFILASPVLFRLVNKLTMNLGNINILNEDGYPNVVGLMLHSIVFILIVRISMEY